MFRAFLFLLLWLVSFAAFAQERLTFEACLEAVIQKNPDIKAAQKSLQGQIFQLRGAYSNFFPQLSASFNLNYGTGSSNLVGGGNLGAISNDGGADLNLLASLSGKQNLFSGFQDVAKVEQTKASRATLELNLISVKAQLSYNLKSAFASLVYAQSAVALTAEIRLRREHNFKLVSLRYDNGRENKGSYLLAKAYLEQAQYDELVARDAQYVAKTQLANVMGREDIDAIEVAGVVPESPPPASVDAHALVLETPAYKTTVYQEKSAGAAMAIARAPLFPLVNLNGSVGNSNSSDSQSSRWLIGFEVVFPFFSGGKDFYAFKSAKESLRASTFAKESALRQGVVKLQQSYLAYVEAVQRVLVDQSFVEAATTRSKISRERYNNGLLTFEDWDVIENDLVSREKSLIQSRRDRVIAESAWELAQGKGAIL